MGGKETLEEPIPKSKPKLKPRPKTKTQTTTMSHLNVHANEFIPTPATNLHSAEFVPTPTIPVVKLVRTHRIVPVTTIKPPLQNPTPICYNRAELFDLPFRLQTSQAFSDRTLSTLSTSTRLRQYIDLACFTDYTGRLLTRSEIACQNPSHGVVSTTNVDYWKILNAGHVNWWKDVETVWVDRAWGDISREGCLEDLEAQGLVDTTEALRRVFGYGDVNPVLDFGNGMMPVGLSQDQVLPSAAYY